MAAIQSLKAPDHINMEDGVASCTHSFEGLLLCRERRLLLGEHLGLPVLPGGPSAGQVVKDGEAALDRNLLHDR